MNRLSERAGELPIDPERRLLESRIEHAKDRIVEDLNRASVLVRGVARDVAERTERGLGRLALFAGLAVAGLVVLGVMRARARAGRRVRVTWK